MHRLKFFCFVIGLSFSIASLGIDDLPDEIVVKYLDYSKSEWKNLNLVCQYWYDAVNHNTKTLKIQGICYINDFLPKLPNLRSLEITHKSWPLCNLDLAFLENCPNMTYLNIRGCININTKYLPKLKKLKYLNIEFCNLEKDDIKQIVDGCPLIEELYY